MSAESTTEKIADTVLVVEDEVLVRTALAQYLRDCGYRVIEAASGAEAITVLARAGISVHIVFSGVEIPAAMSGFALSRWVRTHRPEVKLILAGNVAKAAQAAGDLCEEGPHLKKPYEPQQVVDWIKRLRSSKT